MSANRFIESCFASSGASKPESVEYPRHDDVVGDAGLGEFAVPVDAELVDAYGLELEWVVGAAVLGQQLLELADDLGQLIARQHRAGPAVADARGALQRHLGVAADIERHRLGRRRAHLQLVEVVELAVELDHAAGEDELDHLDHLVDALAALGVRLRRTTRIPQVPSRSRRRTRTGCWSGSPPSPPGAPSAAGCASPSFITLV